MHQNNMCWHWKCFLYFLLWACLHWALVNKRDNARWWHQLRDYLSMLLIFLKKKIIWIWYCHHDLLDENNSILFLWNDEHTWVHKICITYVVAFMHLMIRCFDNISNPVIRLFKNKLFGNNFLIRCFVTFIHNSVFRSVFTTKPCLTTNFTSFN